MNIITVYRDRDNWVARHSDPEISELFGTDTLPTAFMTTVPARDVFDEIRKLNPSSEVRVLDLFGNVFYSTDR